MTNKSLLIGITAGLSLTFAVIAAEEKKEAKKVDASKLPAASSKKDLTYDKDIKPIFEKSCFGCHGSEKQKGKLRLDSLDAALKGGENGPDIIKGKSAESTLVHAISDLLDEEENMPPTEKREKYPALTKDQVGLVRAWIDQGAK